MQGIVIENISNKYKIKSQYNIYNAYARGKFKTKNIKPIIGDNVRISIIDEEKKEGIIEEILPRKNEIKRPRIANIDQVIYIIATKNPKPDLLMLDKQLAYAEKMDIEPVIVINKIDLQDTYKNIEKIYKKIGYNVVITSAKQNIGILELKQTLNGKISVFSGNSGVGKSSIINSIFNKEKTQEGEISKKTKKGKQTTTNTKLYEIDKDSYIADTPGFSSFEINEIASNELDKCFREFKKEISKCEFIGCTHIKEENCGVKEAVLNGRISKERYESYCQIYNESLSCSIYKK